MADKSWGLPSTTPPARRASGGAEGLLTRIDARAAAREAAAVEREQQREARRTELAALAEKDPHAAAASRQRGSGRKDVVREQRDTTGYSVVVDEDRIRLLARRGASLAALAATFGLTGDAIEGILNDAA
ncbi:hypothetical protein GGQ80_003253 [Sphingomonas jinjuensis]|uniref:Uncharacterized protein n=1 Tax=Sphingomonas jinjuensis TaxID=535907 RepID=A0A840F7V9_9SPHN|nr:hypothetical protein [Sphingomonas jinjuensis]MBB4155333.1 hypothetical protein [Sphingomonas jinjuensis]